MDDSLMLQGYLTVCAVLAIIAFGRDNFIGNRWLTITTLAVHSTRRLIVMPN